MRFRKRQEEKKAELPEALKKVMRSQERLAKNIYGPGGAMPAQLGLGGKKFFYAYGWKEVLDSKKQLVTRLYVDGPTTTRQEAELKLHELELDAGDIWETDSKDAQKVKKQIAAQLIHEHGMKVEEATGRKYRRDLGGKDVRHNR